MRVRSLEASVECGTAKVAHTVCSDITVLANVHPSWYHLSVRPTDRCLDLTSLRRYRAPSVVSKCETYRLAAAACGRALWTRA